MNFVVGHPRSGTMLLTALLNAGGARRCRHEYLCHLSSMGVSLPTQFYAGDASREQVLHLLDHYRFSPTPWVDIDSNWKLTWILPVLLERFPEARVLHLCRDPRANVRSCHNLDIYGRLHHRRPFLDRQFWLEWMPDIRRADWGSLGQLQRNCAFWTETHRLALDGLAAHPHVLRVRLEDIGGQAGRADIFEFFGVPIPGRGRLEWSLRRPVNARRRMKAKLRLFKRDGLAAQDRWHAGQKATLQTMCGEMAERLGYRI